MPNQTPIPTQINIAPSGMTWKNWKLVHGTDGFTTRETMEKYLCNPDRVRDLEECRDLNLQTIKQLEALIQLYEAQMEAVGAGGVEPLRKRNKLHQIAEPDAQHLQELAAYRFTVDNLRARVAELEAQLAESTHPTQQGLDAREFPAMTPELASILGLMCFQCIPFAQALRAGGQQINTRAEDEQAAVLHWMLGHYFRHSEAWRAAAAEDMEHMKAHAIAAQAKQGEQENG